jgi:DNA-binding transcriptional ArsR family regulator
MDLVRNILITIEADATETLGHLELVIEGRSDEEIAYHLTLLSEAGLVDARVQHFMGGGSAHLAHRLTWQGHEFLDSVRDPEIWRQTKEGAKKAGASTIEMIWQIAKAIMKAEIKKRTGLDVS